ncbi:MAG: hypothetical protein GVY08_07840 [Bacteroidetes bacterium]|jgi:hypothetical protein|nr:hypothetical protein [Bacteroidota bacterium]NBC26756.1 hypothetical protein [Bacteroidota bacterium]
MRQFLPILSISILISVPAFGQSDNQKLATAADVLDELNTDYSTVVLADTLMDLNSSTPNNADSSAGSSSFRSFPCLSEMPVLQPDSSLTESMPVLIPPQVDDEMILWYKNPPGKCMTNDPGSVESKRYK